MNDKRETKKVCGSCEHFASGACHHPSKDSPTVTDPKNRPRWCPGFVLRSAGEQ